MFFAPVGQSENLNILPGGFFAELLMRADHPGATDE